MQHGLLDHRSRTLVGGKYFTNNDQTNRYTFLMLHTMSLMSWRRPLRFCQGSLVMRLGSGILISNFQFRDFQIILIYGFYFRVRVRVEVISVQAALEETSMSGRAQCNVVVVCWCNDFLALLSGFAVHELAARYVFSLVSLFQKISATFRIKFNFM